MLYFRLVTQRLTTLQGTIISIINTCSTWGNRHITDLNSNPWEPSLARGLGSVMKHSTADPGIASSIPLTPTKITKKEICTGSSQEKCSRVSVLYTGHVKEPGLSCVVGTPVSCTMGY